MQHRNERADIAGDPNLRHQGATHTLSRLQTWAQPVRDRSVLSRWPRRADVVGVGIVPAWALVKVIAAPGVFGNAVKVRPLPVRGADRLFKQGLQPVSASWVEAVVGLEGVQGNLERGDLGHCRGDGRAMTVTSWGDHPQKPDEHKNCAQTSHHTRPGPTPQARYRQHHRYTPPRDVEDEKSRYR